MKKKIAIIVIGILVAAAVALGLYFLLRSPKANGASMVLPQEEEHHEEEEGAIKEVELNMAQFTASGIVLGTFESKNLSEVINANGYTKLPPQNQADVSVMNGGVVKTIKVIEGQQVSSGQTLATIESPEFTKLQEAFLTSKSSLQYLSSEFQRQKTLSEENVSARKTFERTRADYEIETARYQSLQRQLGMLRLDTTRIGGGAVQVVAPISGFITEVYIKIGSNVEPGKPLFSIVDNSQMHVDLLVYEKDLQKVKPGQKVRFVLTNQDNTEIMGEIFSVGKAFENETKSVAVHADIQNDKQLLIPGMYVNALIDIGSQPVNTLPVDAVIKADGREFIFVLEEGHGEESGKEHGEEGHAHQDGEKQEEVHDHAKGERKHTKEEGHDHAEGEEEAHEEEGNDHAESGEHKDTHGTSYHFQRIEVKTGTAQLGFVQVTPVQHLEPGAKLVVKGAYYIQSHLLKSEGGGGHEH
jgi:cobalt-zinc-cadmium efflux system membrane fusion protein